MKTPLKEERGDVDSENGELLFYIVKVAGCTPLVGK